MSTQKSFILANDLRRRAAMAAVAVAPEGYCVEVREASRTLTQNAAQWPYLEAFSEQLTWPVNGARVSMSPDEWKDVLTAAFHGETVRLAMGLNGGVVMLGLRTSKMGKRRFSEWLEFLSATAVMRGVRLRAPEPSRSGSQLATISECHQYGTADQRDGEPA